MAMKKIKIKKRWLIPSVISIAMLAAYLVLTVIYDAIAASLPDQYSARKWSPDSKQYSQTSCFISENYNFSTDSVYQLRSAVDSALEQASISKDENNPDSRLWIDAYSAETFIDVSSESCKIPVKAKADFCGGDFFYFHDFKYKSGYCFSEDDINSDRVVIDENLSWKLFGSTDTEGMEIYINGITFKIAGTVGIDDDKVSELTYGSDCRIYLPYSAYEKIYVSSSLSADTPTTASLPITCYEIIMPSPVSKFGYKIIQEQFEGQTDKISVIENSSRFSLRSMLGVMKSYGTRSVITNDITYPYWENSARVVEDKLALILFFRIPLIAVPVIYVLVIIVILWIKYFPTIRDFKNFADKLIDIKRQKVYYKKYPERRRLNEKQ